MQQVACSLLDNSALAGFPLSARDPSAVSKGLEADLFGLHLQKVVSEIFARLSFRMQPFDSESIHVIDARRLANTNGTTRL